MTLFPQNEFLHPKPPYRFIPPHKKTVTFVEIYNPIPAEFVEAEEQTDSYSNSKWGRTDNARGQTVIGGRRGWYGRGGGYGREREYERGGEYEIEAMGSRCDTRYKIAL